MTLEPSPLTRPLSDAGRNWKEMERDSAAYYATLPHAPGPRRLLFAMAGQAWEIRLAAAAARAWAGVEEKQ